jgi:hypothetical protein
LVYTGFRLRFQPVGPEGLQAGGLTGRRAYRPEGLQAGGLTGRRAYRPEGRAYSSERGLIMVIMFTSSARVSGIRRCQVSGVRKQYEVIANFVDVEGIGENIGANDSSRKAAQAAIPKIGFI